jgi:MFS family permease
MSAPAESTTARPTKFLGWRILAFATVTAALTGPGQTIGVSVFIDHIISDLGLTRSEVSTAYLIGTMLGALTLPTVGRWIDRVGVRPAITAIGAGFAAALVAMGGVGNFITLAAGFTFIRLLGQGSLSLASTVAVTHWFDRRRGFALGLFATASGALMALTPVFLNLVINAYSWRTAWIVAGIAILVIVVPIARWGMISYPSDVGQVPDGAPTVPADGIRAPARASATRAEALRTVGFWILLAGSASNAMLSTALNFHQISLLGEAGMSSAEAALMFLPQVVGGSLAGIGMGALTDRVSARWLIPVTMLFLAGALGLASIVSRGWLVVAYAICLGLANGSGRAVGAAFLPKWFGVGHIGSIQGFMTFAGVAASAVGPVAFSLGRDRFGDFGSASLFYAAIPLTVALAAVALLDRPGKGRARPGRVPD